MDTFCLEEGCEVSIHLGSEGVWCLYTSKEERREGVYLHADWREEGRSVFLLFLSFSSEDSISLLRSFFSSEGFLSPDHHTTKSLDVS